jgi:hypothetical protein
MKFNKDANYVTGFMMFFSSYSKNGVKTADGTYNIKNVFSFNWNLQKLVMRFYIDDKLMIPISIADRQKEINVRFLQKRTKHFCS